MPLLYALSVRQGGVLESRATLEGYRRRSLCRLSLTMKDEWRSLYSMENFRTFTLDSIQAGFKGVLELPLFPVVGRELKIPVMVARGHRPGPVFLVVAGVHGDEFEGMEAICRVYEALEPDRMSGMFVGIPVCNMLA